VREDGVDYSKINTGVPALELLIEDENGKHCESHCTKKHKHEYLVTPKSRPKNVEAYTVGRMKVPKVHHDVHGTPRFTGGNSMIDALAKKFTLSVG
jgi:hypothetical protein